MMNKSWKDVPVPVNMLDLKKDDRGFPIPFVILIDDNKTVHFRINDTRKVELCRNNTLCNICGKKMKDGMWFIGGPRSAYDPNGAFNDSPVHYDCGKYALQVCPYMAFSQYSRKPIDLNKVETDVDGFIDFTQSEERLPFFCFVKTKKYKVSPKSGFLLPQKPYIKTEYWLDGKTISIGQVIEILSLKGDDIINYIPLNL